MADLTVTAANVRSYGTRVEGIAGGTITAGQAVRKNTSGQWVTAQSTSAANAATEGIALNAASVNQPVSVHTSGLIDPGATAAVGKVYVQSANAGGIAPVDDIAGGEFVTVIGVGTTASRIKTGFVQSGVAAAGAVT